MFSAVSFLSPVSTHTWIPHRSKYSEHDLAKVLGDVCWSASRTDSLRYFVLKVILNGRSTDKLEVRLDVEVHGIQLVRSVLQLIRCLDGCP